MTKERPEFGLNLEPIAGHVASFDEILVPMHADNFALALASGYIGGSLKNDAAQDVQSSLGTAVVGFKSIVPEWAITAGESGDRVILSITRELNDNLRDGIPEIINGPLRITSISSVYFKDDLSLANFSASYDAFPDVLTELIDKKINWPVGGETERSNLLDLVPVRSGTMLADLDFFGGLAVGVIDLLAGGEFDGSLCEFLNSPSSGVEGNAHSLLLAMEPKSSNLDLAIWAAAFETLRSRFGKKGFDRRDFLADMECRLSSLRSEAEPWVRGCQKIIDAEIDIPSLADNEKLGRRAALAIILSHEPMGLGDLEENLDAGAKVRGLVSLAVHAFAGLSRAPAQLKGPKPRMAAILEIGERLLSGESTVVEFETKAIASDLTRHQAVKIAGEIALERKAEPPAHMVMLKARIQEAGYKVELDPISGRIGIRAGYGKGPFIIVEECRRSTSENPVVNLVLPVATMPTRPSVAFLRTFMIAAWEFGTTVALRNNDRVEEVIGMASLPLATLDRDELNFHVERLLLVSEALGGKKRKRKVTDLGGQSIPINAD